MRMIYSLIISIFLLIPFDRVFANFEDNFDNNLSLDNYTIYENNGNVSVSNGYLAVESQFGNKSFPYIILDPSKYTLPIKSVEVTFKYDLIGRFGAGIVITDTTPMNGEYYDVGHEALLWSWNWGSPPFSRYGYYPFVFSDLVPQNSDHKLRLINNTNSYDVYVDDNLVSNFNSIKNINSIWIGNPQKVNTFDDWPRILIDSIKIEDSSTVLPSFPYFAQNDGTWGSKEYDHASSWAPLGQDGIDRWGCALTSVAMILKHNGVKTPAGTEINPDILNDWLKSQSDGYISPGLINWMAVTRYVLSSYNAGQSPTKLEYVRKYMPDTPNLPFILGIPGHFVVAHDEDTLNWIINDPASKTITTLPKTSTIKSINQFVPSNTDLSYLMFVSASQPGLDITSPASATTSASWEEEYIADDAGTTSSPKRNISYYPKPDKGSYKLKISNTHTTSIDVAVYLYDKLASNKMIDLSVEPGEHSYELYFDNDTVALSSIHTIDTTAPPTPTQISPADNTMTKSSAVNLSWTSVADETSSVRYEYMVDGTTASTSATSANLNLSEGNKIWKVRACDAVANCSSWSPEWSVMVDLTAPSSVISIPPLSPWDKTISGTASDNLSGIKEIAVSIKQPNGVMISQKYLTPSWQYNFPSAMTGEYEVSSVATDQAGNTQASPTTYKFRYSEPTSLPLPPKQIHYWHIGLGNRVLVDWDKVKGASKYQIYFGTRADNLRKIDETKSTSWISQMLAKGTYYLAVATVDSRSNRSNLSKPIKIEIWRSIFPWSNEDKWSDKNEWHDEREHR